MDEATLGAESRMFKRVGTCYKYYRMYIVMYFISYWKSLVHHNFISKIKKITLYCENSITFFPVATAVAIVFLDPIFFDFFTFQCQI
jgi:hypothetical protein